MIKADFTVSFLVTARFNQNLPGTVNEAEKQVDTFADASIEDNRSFTTALYAASDVVIAQTNFLIKAEPAKGSSRMTATSREELQALLRDRFSTSQYGVDFQYCQGVFGMLQQCIYLWNEKQGFWESDNTGEKLMLIVTELAEAMEGDRKDLMDDKVTSRKMFEVELADALIRIFDLAGRYNLDLAGALFEKMLVNLDRPFKHGKKY